MPPPPPPVDDSHPINKSSPRKLFQGHHVDDDDDDDNNNNNNYESFHYQSPMTKRQQYWDPPPNNSNKNENGEEPLRVDFRCACFKLSNISTVDFTVLIKFVVVFEWNDERLISSNITTNELPPDLWGPDIILENAQNDCEVIYDSFSLMDNTTGRLKRTVTFHGSVYNPMDLEDFPFDADELEMKFISISNWRTLDGTRYGNNPCSRIYTLHPMLKRKDVPFLILGWGGTYADEIRSSPLKKTRIA
jgi:hypothetical protein